MTLALREAEIGFRVDACELADDIDADPSEIEANPFHADEQSTGSTEEPRLFQLEAIDWPRVIARGVPELEYVSAPYLPARKRILAVGPSESAKSIWAAHKSAEATRHGLIVCHVSQENGLEEEIRRFVRLKPDFERLRLYVDQGLDLANGSHVGALIEASMGAALCVIDTLSACWSGDEDSNHAITSFDRDVLLPLIRETGASPVVIDHTGNPQPFVRRRGVSAPRGQRQRSEGRRPAQVPRERRQRVHHRPRKSERRAQRANAHIPGRRHRRRRSRHHRNRGQQRRESRCTR